MRRITSRACILILLAVLPVTAKPLPSKAELKRTHKTVTKMRNTEFPEVTFNQANLQNVIDVLNEMSLAGDKTGEKSGVNIVLAMTEPAVRKPTSDPEADPFVSTEEPQPITAGRSPVPLVTFKARKISLYETLKIVAQIAGLKVRVEGSIVFLVPKDAPDEALEVRTYHVMPTLSKRMSELGSELRRGK